MDNIAKMREALKKDLSLRDNFIASIIELENKSGYPENNVRDTFTGLLCDQLFMGERFSKKLTNGLVINFVYNSKIAREFLLSQPAVPNHVWEPQTTKLLLHFASGAKNVIIAGAYFGDHAIPIAHLIRETGTCHTFEPNKNNSDLIIENAKANGLDNIINNNLALWNKSGEKLQFEGEDALASTVHAKEPGKHVLHTITIDDYAAQAKLKEVNLIMIDVEGSEMKVLEGATELLKTSKPVVVFETHSSYSDWSQGLENSDSVKLMTSLGYEVYAVREFHQNIDTGNMPVELLPLDATYHATPPDHGFNLLGVPNKKIVENKLFRIVHGLSPKLLLHKHDDKFSPSKF